METFQQVMYRFFAALLAAALRLAKLDLIRQYKQDALPYFWAGFTLHGESGLRGFPIQHTVESNHDR